ncbi:MAG TPA: hypothetical protein VIH00_03290 [Candidatus Limnocylindrales bacterium]
MATIGSVTVRLVPWDDPAFTAAFERAADLLRAKGTGLDTPADCLELQRLLRDAGYPKATADCDRDVEEALSHHARIVVSRDGAARQTVRPTS